MDNKCTKCGYDETNPPTTPEELFDNPDSERRYVLAGIEYVLSSDLVTNGRIYVPSGVTAVVDLNGHTIDAELNADEFCSSVFGVAEGGKLTVKNGTVTGGYRKDGNGGGFNVNGELILEDVTIIGCHARDAGGGIFINGNNASATLRGNCVIQNNSAGTLGGGIFVNGNANLYIEGKPIVRSNADSSGISNVYLKEGRKINITGKLNEDANVGVTYEDEGSDGFTSGYSDHNTSFP